MKLSVTRVACVALAGVCLVAAYLWLQDALREEEA